MTLPEVRCPKCHRLWFYGWVLHLAIRCPKCHYHYVSSPQDVEKILALLTEHQDGVNAYTETRMSP